MLMEQIVALQEARQEELAEQAALASRAAWHCASIDAIDRNIERLKVALKAEAKVGGAI